MKHLKKIVGIVFLVSVFFKTQPANAIPVPTLGAEIPNQISMLMKHVDELMKVKDQITNGINQAKSMGDKLSLDALKGLAGTGGVAKGSAIDVKIPSEMSKTGYSEDVAKDPEKTRAWVEKMGGSSGKKMTKEEKSACLDMKSALAEELTTANMAAGLSMQSRIASGKDIEDTQEIVKNASDQMQLIGANTAVHMKGLEMKAFTLAMQANTTANQSVDNLCP